MSFALKLLNEKSTWISEIFILKVLAHFLAAVWVLPVPNELKETSRICKDLVFLTAFAKATAPFVLILFQWSYKTLK
jgi:hypothetical protein